MVTYFIQWKANGNPNFMAPLDFVNMQQGLTVMIKGLIVHLHFLPLKLLSHVPYQFQHLVFSSLKREVLFKVQDPKVP